MQEVTGVLSKTRQLETEIERLETDIQKTGNFWFIDRLKLWFYVCVQISLWCVVYNVSRMCAHVRDVMCVYLHCLICCDVVWICDICMVSSHFLSEEVLYLSVNNINMWIVWTFWWMLWYLSHSKKWKTPIKKGLLSEDLHFNFEVKIVQAQSLLRNSQRLLHDLHILPVNLSFQYSNTLIVFTNFSLKFSCRERLAEGNGRH